MKKLTLTVIDSTGIQDYVFGSNRLRENIAASELVHQATHDWVYQALPQSSNVDLEKGTLDSGRMIGAVAAEVVYLGGGNAVVLFQDEVEARGFAERLTRRVLRQAPGLQLVIVHRSFDWENDLLRNELLETLDVHLARKKQRRQPSLPLLGLGVTAACRSTGLAAAALDPETKNPIAQEVAVKLKAQDAADERLQASMSEVTATKIKSTSQQTWKFTRSFDDLGRVKGEESYIGVVHADGNHMGGHLARVGADLADNRKYVTALRAFSEAINRVGSKALADTAALLLKALNSNPDLPRNAPWFPMRPIVFGGDDVTFVCHGSYGLALAAHYLTAFEQAAAAEQVLAGHELHACAGVAIVKVHYPFARAYQLSQELCKSAKQQVKELTAVTDASALDWHFANSGLSGSLEDILEREYTVFERSDLRMRPVLLQTQSAGDPSWPLFVDILEAFHADPDWRDKRNKVKALREALRRGPDATKEFSRTYGLDTLPHAGDIPILDIGMSGWGTQRCYYFDPIEAMDLCDFLETRAAKSSAAAAPAAGMGSH